MDTSSAFEHPSRPIPPEHTPAKVSPPIVSPLDPTMASLGFTQGDISSLIADVLGASKSTADTSNNTNSNNSTSNTTANTDAEATPTPGTTEKSANSTPTSTRRPSSTTPIEEVPVPSYVMFGRAEGELEHIISQSALQKLPKEPLAKLAAHGKYQGVILMMDNYNDCQSMLRLKDFLETGKYRPFKPKTALEYVDANGVTKPWADANKDTRIAVNVTNTTKELFLAEIDLYKFAIRIGYEDLRKRSALALRQDYPVSVDCIWHLLTKVYRTAASSGDAAFAKHIISLVSSNSVELTEIQAYVREMKQHIKVDGELGIAMVEGYISASETVRRKLMDASKQPLRRESTKEASSGAVKELSSPVIKREIKSPVDRESTNPALRSLQPNGLRFADLERLARSIYDGNLAMAVEDGYGTLVHKDFPARNRDFVFARGELLMVNDLESATNGRNNIMVYNRRGQRGDILRKLVRRVPSNLGVEGREYTLAENPVFCPRIVIADKL
jgi:hypothetical protein